MATRNRRRRRRRRRNGGFILTLLTICIVVAAIVMSGTVFLKVADISVSGSTRYDSKDIIATSGIETGDNMFMINKFDVANRILEKYPYIESIKIRRRLPDTFLFNIKEREPAAYIENAGNRWLIDKNAYLLEMLSSEAETVVPKISGAQITTPQAGARIVLKNENQLMPLCEVLSALEFSELSKNVRRIEIEKLYDIRIVYEDRFLVSLGDTEELTRKIEMLKAVLNELAEFDKGTINVSAIKEARFKPNSKIDLSEKSQTPLLPDVLESLTDDDVENIEEKAEGDETEEKSEEQTEEDGGISEE